MLKKDEVLIKIGNSIVEIRKEKGISQAQLAADCNFEKSNMSRIEKGRTNLTIGTLLIIANAMDVSINRIIGQQ